MFWEVPSKNWMGPNPNGPRDVSCDRAIRYSGFFGVRSGTVLLEISWRSPILTTNLWLFVDLVFLDFCCVKLMHPPKRTASSQQNCSLRGRMTARWCGGSEGFWGSVGHPKKPQLFCKTQRTQCFFVTWLHLRSVQTTFRKMSPMVDGSEIRLTTVWMYPKPCK